MAVSRVHGSIVVIHRSLKVKIFLGSFCSESFPWLFITDSLSILWLRKKFCSGFESVRAVKMPAHVLKVVFVSGLQKLREIIGLKLGKKITLTFPVSVFLDTQ